jgi:ribosomal protein L32
MPVPKRRHSKKRTRLKRFEKLFKKVLTQKTLKKTANGGYKRPHVEEEIQL